MNDQEKIKETIKLITDYGDFDGAHHKQWVLTTALKILMGEAKYAEWLAEYNSSEEYFDWDEGIAP